MHGRRVLSLGLVFLMLVSCFTFHVSAEDTSYATREYTVHVFVSTIGTANLPNEKADLSQFIDQADVTPEYADSLALAVGNGLLKGYEDNSLRPKDTIKRVEALALLSRALPDLSVTVPGATFNDIPDWAVFDIERLAQAGLVLGYGDGTFGAGDLLTVEQVGFLIERLRANNPSGELRLEDDFYATVNQEYLKNEIPAGYTEKSVLFDMNLDAFYKQNDIIMDYIDTDKRPAKGTTAQKIQDFFLNLADSEMREELGVTPISSLTYTIDQARDIHELVDAAAAISYYTGQDTLLNLSVGNDPLSSNQYALYVGFGSSLLAKEEITGGSNPEIPAAFQTYLETLFLLDGYSKSGAKASAKQVFGLCQELADTAIDINKVKDPQEYYTAVTEKNLTNYAKNFNVSRYMKLIGIPEASGATSGHMERIILADTNLIKKMDSYYTNENLELMKDYCKAVILMDNASYLTQGFLDAYNRFYSVRFGVDAEFTPVDIAANVTQNYFAIKLGEEFVKRYSSEQATNDVNSFIKEIVGVYRGRINQLSWMTEATKKEAIKKLDSLKSYVNHPNSYTSIIDYIDILGTEGSGPANIFSIDALTKWNNYHFIGKEIDKDGWQVYPQTVNAFYDPTTNSITIPAGILQDPVYSADAGRMKNLGGIGSIIAHEISHAFDSTGSLYDENGDRKDWWTEADKKAFNERTQALVEQFNEVEVLPGYYIDGDMTLGENMADLTGIRCLLDLTKGASQTDLQMLFEQYASIWAEVVTDTATISNLKLDVHSPGKYRVNTILSNFEEFIQCYGIEKGDKMYRAPEVRVSIW